MRHTFAIVVSTLTVLLAQSIAQCQEKKLSEQEQAAWDQSLKILGKPDKLVLYSLDPLADPKEKGGDRFRGWKVLGQTTIDTAEMRKKIASVVESSKPGYGAKCFDPRHGIRAEAGDKSVDIVICFECHWIYVYLNKGDQMVRLTIAPAHQDPLDTMLKAAKVPLPTPAKK